jgi:hypothetical protein
MSYLKKPNTEIDYMFNEDMFTVLFKGDTPVTIAYPDCFDTITVDDYNGLIERNKVLQNQYAQYKSFVKEYRKRL